MTRTNRYAGFSPKADSELDAEGDVDDIALERPLGAELSEILSNKGQRIFRIAEGVGYDWTSRIE